ncbi:MAG TPA: hypothetical protein VMT89_09025 [Candidatus Acidoferrales bacterium]|nr:hypothetical protein [Candidatus Acidoferrales bacterium]
MATKRQQRVARSDGFLAFLDGDDQATQLSKVRAFEWIFVLIVCTEYWSRVALKANDQSLSSWIGLALVTSFGIATLSTRWRQLAFSGLAITRAVLLWNDFPGAGNHAYLEVLLCVLCASFSVHDGEERTLWLRAARWMTCVVFFYAGVQKLVHGYYFSGQALAYAIDIEAFRPILQLLMPHDEFLRLSQYHGKAGDGPYLVSSALVTLLSNATYIIEIGLAVLMALRRTRQIAVIGAILFVIGIETAAREFFFGLIYINMLLLFIDRDVNRRLVGVFAAFLACLLLVRWNILPELIFY